MSQHEIEFALQPVQDVADQAVLAKWILSVLAYRHGVIVTFAPKISIGHAGSGLHVHCAACKNGKNVMLSGKKLSLCAKKIISGYLTLARSLTAFGNRVPTSYFRFARGQEAPTEICWGYRNRSAFLRVPLAWVGAGNMAGKINKGEKSRFMISPEQTVEFRSSDGSAEIYLLLAALCVAAREGFEIKDARRFSSNFFLGTGSSKPVFERLPSSCFESAQCLEKDRKIYEKNGVFASSVIDRIIADLKSYSDEGLSAKLSGKDDEIKKLVDEFLYF